MNAVAVRRHLRASGRVGAALVVAGVACGVASASLTLRPRSLQSASDWARLRRPLHLPKVAPGAECPVSKGVKARTLSKDFGSALALGSGPVYPVVDASGRGMVGARPVAGRRGFFVYKVLFIIAPRYTGPVLVRGRRLDARGGVWFGFGRGALSMEGQIRRGGDGRAWRGFPSSSYVKADGCYGYQMDGLGFSRVAVVRVHRI